MSAQSKIASNPALRAFLAERLEDLTYLQLAAAARVRFGADAPCKSVIARWAARIGRPRPYWPGKIDGDPELRAFAEAEAGRLPPEALVAALRKRFGERAPGRSATYRWLAEHRMRVWRRERGLPDRDPRHARRAARMPQDAREAPTGPGERPGPRCAPAFMKGRLNRFFSGMGRSESAAPCLWCRRVPQNRRRRRRPQPFCGAACRRAFHDAAATLALRAIGETQLSPAEVRAAAFFGAVGLGAASKTEGADAR